MLDFLRLLTPRHADALQPVAPLRRLAGAGADGVPDTVAMDATPTHDGTTQHADPDRGQGRHVRSRSGSPANVIAKTGLEPWHRRPDETQSTAPLHPAPSNKHHADATDTRGKQADPFQEWVQDTRTEGLPVTRTKVAMPRRIDGIEAPSSTHGDTVRNFPVDDALYFARSPIRSRESPFAAITPISPATVAMHAPERASPPPPPEIHVSIDRIEVRAPTVAKAPQRQRPRPAHEPQSLHDYLRGKVAP